ncbi:uncharacterized protein LOC62_02G002648 [Vanrija pseudolonga]|uniref:UBA domain-containing protein n=1 Tax=Vanrija pseudolonga TaxID=143232 RepID=A0AAF0Y472_9TREE|nr:hypothetical protein LOC62_02G002648 [Vanrija pseudolonga]
MSSPDLKAPGFRNWVRRVSHDILERPVVPEPPSEDIDELVNMGFPRNLAQRQLHLSRGNKKAAAESLVHSAHMANVSVSSKDAWNHPDCPICVRESENVRISEGRRGSVAEALGRVRSRGGDGVPEPTDRRRGSVGAMLRRPSVAAALQRMSTRDVK